MHHVFLLPEYPPAAEAWIEYLPNSMHIEVEEEHEGRLQAIMTYAQPIGLARRALPMANWSYEFDPMNGRIIRIDFFGHRDLGIFDELRAAFSVIAYFAKNAIDPQPYHFGLSMIATCLAEYLEAKEHLLRPGLVPPFSSPML